MTMKVLCVILLLVILDCYCASKVPVCKCGWTFYNGHCYHFSEKSTSWFEAANICKRQRGYLVKIDSRAENNFLTKYANVFVKTRSHARNIGFWMGGNDLGKEGKWEWEINNAHMAFRNFYHGQPDNAGGKEHCGHLWSQSRGFRWNDARCDICESDVYNKNPCTCKV